MIKRMDSVGNAVIIEERSVGEIINELTLNGETLEDKHAQLVDQVNDLVTKLDEAVMLDKVESLESRMDDIDNKIDELAGQLYQMARNAEAFVQVIKQVATD
tara:strand:- start:158 stop:463 length:306 start_codon:yes stop_codon:yes gene_type:complete